MRDDDDDDDEPSSDICIHCSAQTSVQPGALMSDTGVVTFNHLCVPS